MLPNGLDVRFARLLVGVTWMDSNTMPSQTALGEAYTAYQELQQASDVPVLLPVSSNTALLPQIQPAWYVAAAAWMGDFQLAVQLLRSRAETGRWVALRELQRMPAVQQALQSNAEAQQVFAAALKAQNAERAKAGLPALNAGR